MSTDRREELIRKANEVRSHMLHTLDEFERKSQVEIAGTYGGGTKVETEEAATSPERRRLERKADRVRDHMIDTVEQLELKARERILPIVIVSSAALLFLTVGFGFLCYRALRR
jgi:hypothetical protein